MASRMSESFPTDADTQSQRTLSKPEKQQLQNADALEKAQSVLPSTEEVSGNEQRKFQDEYLVQLDASEDPKHISPLHKWAIVVVISVSALCTAFASSCVRSPLRSFSVAFLEQRSLFRQA